MPAPLQKEIESHLASFPERYKDVEEMRREWAEFKSRVFWLIVSSIGIIVTYGVWIGTVQTNQAQMQSQMAEFNDNQKISETRITTLEINNGEIKTRLSSIDATLQEIKLAIKNIR